MEPRALPQDPVGDAETANERFKSAFDTRLWSSLIVATLLHAVLFAFWPSMQALDVSFTGADLEAITLPPEIEIPKPPERIARPATPVISDAVIDDDITIAPTTFLDNPIESLPLPRPETEGDGAGDLSAAPVFTPYTTPPVLQNRSEVARALKDGYPPLLKDAGIGGLVHVHVFIDVEGRVQNAVVAAASGYPQFDRVAKELALVMRFNPALNRDRKVPVWISIPVRFEVR